jgi:TRAP-type C4-dicarboxylate transport system substrate-binding protein
VRVMPSRTAIAMVEALGAKPVPIPFGELYSALDTGTVDGAENNAPSLYTSRQYEVASSYSLNEHAILPDVLVIGTRTWERLNEQEREWLREAARRSAIAQRRMWEDSEVESLREMRKAGLTIVTEVDRAAFRERVRPVYARPEFRLPEMLALIAAVDTQRRSSQRTPESTP